MTWSSFGGSLRSAAAAASSASLLLIATASGEAASTAAQSVPARVDATYRVTFNGFDIGSFHFRSEQGPQGYTMSTQADLSALLGAFKWKGTSRSSGQVVASEPRPSGYMFDYKTNSKVGSVKLGFQETRVANVSIVPPSDTHPDTVPVKEQHLKDVLDPLSAVMALTRGGSANPCGRKLAVFDGKQRFDLVLSFRRQERIAEARPSGQPGFAFVCRVRYVPIAGYRANEDTKQLAANAGIEIALRPVPSANLFVPYQVTIPTMAGSAVLTAQRVEITTHNKGQIALVH